MTGRARLAAEIIAVVVVVMICLAAVRLPPSDTALVTLLAIALLGALRLAPETASPRLPRDRAPERAGRRADVYRLSWGLSPRDEFVSPQISHRLEAVVTERLEQPWDPAGPAAPVLAHLADLASGALRTGRLTPAELRRTLTALEELDRLDQRTRGFR